MAFDLDNLDLPFEDAQAEMGEAVTNIPIKHTWEVYVILAVAKLAQGFAILYALCILAFMLLFLAGCILGYIITR